MKRTCFAILACLMNLLIAGIGWADDGALKGYPADWHEPLVFENDNVGVTAEGTLRGRFRHWGNWEQELQSRLADAKANAKARGTPGRKLVVGCIFLKDARVVFPNIKGGDGKPLEGIVSTPQKYIDQMKSSCMPEFNDFIFAFTRGEVEAEWHFETLAGLTWTDERKSNPAWSCQPRAIGEQLEKALANYQDKGIVLWCFPGGTPKPLNPIDAKQQIAGPPWGISYPAWPLHGGYCLVAGSPLAELIIHEFNHKFLDGLGNLQGVQLTMNHGLGRLAWANCGLVPKTRTDYALTYYWIIRRDMWRRFSVAPNPQPIESFSGKAYEWEQVKHDCWFKLPELDAAALAELTTLPSLKMDARRNANYRRFSVANEDRGKLKSPYVELASETDAELNNLLSLATESAAVLQTDSGTWLIVRPEMADLYVNMPGLAGKNQPPLPVYGYIREGIRPLLVVKAPAGMPLPGGEEGFFRKTGKSQAKGIGNLQKP